MLEERTFIYDDISYRNALNSSSAYSRTDLSHFNIAARIDLLGFFFFCSFEGNMILICFKQHTTHILKSPSSATDL